MGGRGAARHHARPRRSAPRRTRGASPTGSRAGSCAAPTARTSGWCSTVRPARSATSWCSRRVRCHDRAAAPAGSVRVVGASACCAGPGFGWHHEPPVSSWIDAVTASADHGDPDGARGDAGVRRPRPRVERHRRAARSTGPTPSRVRRVEERLPTPPPLCDPARRAPCAAPPRARPGRRRGDLRRRRRAAPARRAARAEQRGRSGGRAARRHAPHVRAAATATTTRSPQSSRSARTDRCRCCATAKCSAIPMMSRDGVKTAVVLIAVAIAGACGSGQQAATTMATSELHGTISAGPSCPVEQIGNPCPPVPVSARVEIRNASGRVVAATTSGGDGRYSVRVPAGVYTVVVVTATMPSCPPKPVHVRANAEVNADVTCDSGIR